MAKIDLGDSFDSISTGYELLKEGFYNFKVTDAKLEAKGSNQLLTLTLKEEKAGQLVFDTLWIKHENKVAQDIGLKKLKTLATIADIEKLDDTDKLLQKDVNAKVYVEDGGTYDDRNRISFYKRYDKSLKMFGEAAKTDEIPF